MADNLESGRKKRPSTRLEVYKEAIREASKGGTVFVVSANHEWISILAAEFYEQLEKRGFNPELGYKRTSTAFNIERGEVRFIIPSPETLRGARYVRILVDPEAISFLPDDAYVGLMRMGVI